MPGKLRDRNQSVEDEDNNRGGFYGPVRKARLQLSPDVARRAARALVVNGEYDGHQHDADHITKDPLSG